MLRVAKQTSELVHLDYPMKMITHFAFVFQAVSVTLGHKRLVFTWHKHGAQKNKLFELETWILGYLFVSTLQIKSKTFNTNNGPAVVV